MTTAPKIQGDRLVLATVSVLRTLILELDRVGAIELRSLIASIDATAAAHREQGDPNHLADAIDAIAGQIRESTSNSAMRDN
jgi:hypothetical protein